MSSKKYIVITSIYAPGEAVKKFSTWKGWEVVVVGDRKTPSDWHHSNVTFLSIDEQYRLFPRFAKSIPENTYSRKMIGFLYAITNGAEVIFETDDDNIPHPNAQKVVESMIDEDAHPEHTSLQSQSGWVNVYPYFGSAKSWPRGFPLSHLKDNAVEELPPSKHLKRSVTQFLADQDPDVDAVYRMVIGDEITFAQDRFYTLRSGTYSPFNSQATLWTPETFPLLFFPLGVPDRVTDILRGYIALTCLWKTGRTLGFASPTVYQERNPHNLQHDFLHESMVYQHAQDWAVELQKIEGKTEADLFSAALERLHLLGHLKVENLYAYKKFVEIIDDAKQE